MNATTKSILEDPLNHPIPETREEKVKVLVNLAEEVFEGYSYKSPNQELDRESLNSVLDYVLRFESPYIVLAAHLLYLRFDVNLSGNKKWIKLFIVDKNFYDNNYAAAKQLSLEFGLGVKALENRQ